MSIINDSKTMTCLVCGNPCSTSSARWMDGGVLCEAHFSPVADACHHIALQGFPKNVAELLAVEVVLLGGTLDLSHHADTHESLFSSLESEPEEAYLY